MTADPAGARVAGLHCWIDPRGGLAGDMLVGALVDAGAPLGALQAAVDAVLPGTVRLDASEVRRAGMRATKVDVVPLVSDHPHRRWADIRTMLRAADLPGRVRDLALGAFGRLAVAEARVHGTPEEEVHFHEVGSWDSIADVVAACAGVHVLGIERITAGPAALGSGSVRTAHGEIPVPVPAVLELSAGWRVLAGGTGELTTPTGMALLTTLAQECCDLPELEVRAVGVGAGTRDPAGRANVVRVVLGTQPVADAVPAQPDRADGAVVIAANVDDLDPRAWPSVLAGLMAAGASDAWLTPILMKKGRPAHTVSVLARTDRAAALRERVFALVPTLGLRQWAVDKAMLERTWRSVAVHGGTVRVKLGHRDGVIVSATPEYEDVAAVAAASGTAVRDVLAASIAAAGAAGLVPGGTVPAG